MAAARGCSFAARAPAAAAATIKHPVVFPFYKRLLQIFSLKHIISILFLKAPLLTLASIQKLSYIPSSQKSSHYQSSHGRA